MKTQDWVPFWFEGNIIFGWINSGKEWETVKENYIDSGGLETLRKAQQSEYNGYIFGFLSYCTGMTLAEFFQQNGMEL